MTDLYGKISISGDSGQDKTIPPGKPKKTVAPKPAPKDKQTGSGKRKYLFIPAAILVLLLSYYGLTTLFIPLLIEKKFPDVFQEKTGLNLTLGKVNFNPLNSALIIEDVNISTLSLSADKTDLLTIDNIFIDLDFTALAKKGIASESLLIKGAKLTITKYADATYNISRFLPQNDTDPSAFVNFGELPFLYSLNNIVVTESEILFEDIAAQKSHHIDDIQFSLPTFGNFSFAVDKYIQPDFSAVINGSPVKLSSSTPFSSPGSPPDSSKLSLSLQSINLPIYAGYIPVQLPVIIQRGNADIQIEIAFEAKQDEGSRLNIDYQVQIDNGLFTSHDQAASLETPTLRLEGSIMPFEHQIHVQNLLLRDPMLTIKETLSVSTVDSLLLLNTGDEKAGEGFLRSAAMNITLLIADNGKIVIESDDQQHILHPVQLSIRNFANTKALLKSSDNSTTRSFRLSGESESAPSSFSWQGSFDKTTPTGTFEINKLPAQEFLERTTRITDISAKGSTDIRGKLTVTRDKQVPLAILLDQGSAQITSLSLEEKGRSLLQSATVKLSPLQVDKSTVQLGNIFFDNSALQLQGDAPQALLDIFGDKSKITLQGVDFKGKIIIPQDADRPPLEINDVHLQIKDLEKKKLTHENFAFSASFDKNGSLNAKGQVSVAPLKGVIELAVAGIPATTLLPLFSTSRYTVEPATMVSAAGSYDLASKSFNGKAELSSGTFRDSKKENSFTFSKAVLGKIFADREKKSYQGADIIIQDLSITNKNMSLKTDGTSISAFSIKKGKTEIDNLEFAETRLTIQPDFSLNFASLQQEAENSLTIANIRMFGSVFLYDKNQKESNFIQSFDLTLTPYDTEEPEKNNFAFKAKFPDKGMVSAGGAFRISPLKAALTVELEKIDSKILQHLPSPLAGSGLTAAMSGAINYSYPEKIYTGDMHLSQGQLSNKNNSTKFSWQEADLYEFKLSEAPFAFEAEKLILKTPQTSFSKDNTPVFAKLHDDITNYIKEFNDGKTSSAVSKVKVKRVEMSDGMVDYRDTTFSPPWQSKLRSINGYINNLHTGQTDEQISYSMQGDISDGKFNLDGTFSPAAEGSDNTASFRLTAFPLAMLDDQLSPLFDIGVKNSTVDLTVKKDGSTNEYTADITLSSLEVQDPDSTTALALALLSESSDELSQTIPLTDSAQPLFAQITNYFRRLVVKCSVSPYLLLEWPYDTLQDRNHVSFTPGSTELSMETRDILLDYSALLGKHTRLKLFLNAIVQRSADTKALRDRLMEEERKRVKEENEKLLLEWQQQQIKAKTPPVPEDSIAVEDISEEELSAFTPLTPKNIVITDNMLKQLGIRRAEQIRDYIFEQSAISDNSIAPEADVSIIDTLDMPEVRIRLGHIGQN